MSSVWEKIDLRPYHLILAFVFHFNGYKQPELFFSHLECLIELEPVLRTFEEITFLEAVIQLKKTKVNYHMKC